MRPTKDEVGLFKAIIDASRGTCVRRKVGCVLTDVRGNTLSTGYNGRPAGWTHCTDDPCPGAGEPSGQGLDTCEAIHAEANALLQCPNKDAIHTCYTTTAPCVGCVGLLLNTSCRRIVFLVDYPHSRVSMERWQRHEPRDWYCYPLSEIYCRGDESESHVISAFIGVMLRPDVK